jgi:hypothetical protein
MGSAELILTFLALSTTEARGTYLQQWTHPPKASRPEQQAHGAGEKPFDWMSTLLVNAAQVDVDLDKYARERKRECSAVRRRRRDGGVGSQS